LGIATGLFQAPAIGLSCRVSTREQGMADTDDTTVFYHGTRADLGAGELISAGYRSNYDGRRKSSWVYFAATLEAAVWGAELAAGPGRERIYIVAPTGPYVDDPNLTDKKFPGNPTKSYRSQAPLRVLGELADWPGHPPEQLDAMRQSVARLRAAGVEVID